MTRSRPNAWLTAYVAGLQIVSPGFITVALGRWNCCFSTVEPARWRGLLFGRTQRPSIGR